MLAWFAVVLLHIVKPFLQASSFSLLSSSAVSARNLAAFLLQALSSLFHQASPLRTVKLQPNPTAGGSPSKVFHADKTLLRILDPFRLCSTTDTPKLVFVPRFVCILSLI